MLLTLLLSGYIPPSEGFFIFLAGALTFLALLGIGLLIAGVRQVRRDGARMSGYWLIVAAFAVPALCYSYLVSLV
jgi:hypothetical protein